MIEAFITLYGDNLQIRLGRAEDSFNGAVVKTLVRDDVSVGIDKKQEPVFVRIRHAERSNAVFAKIRDKLAAGQVLTRQDEQAAITAAKAQLRALYAAYRQELQADVAATSNKRVAKDYTEGSRKWAAGIIGKFASAKIKFHTTQPA